MIQGQILALPMTTYEDITHCYKLPKLPLLWKSQQMLVCSLYQLGYPLLIVRTRESLPALSIKLQFQISEMGNNRSMSSLEVTRPSQPKEWVKQRTTGYCDIVRNTQTGLCAEQYSVAVDGRLGRQENFRRYEYRFSHCQYTVQVIQVQKQDSQYLCQGQDFLKVKTQLIPKRLSELGKLNHQDGIYVLSRALNGYKTICELHGPINPTSDMVGVTEDGRVKVWLNENFAKNLPDNEVKNMHQNQTIMIDEIIDMVEEHVQGGYPGNFREMLRQNRPNNFQEALDMLNAFVVNSRMRVPPFLGSSSSLNSNSIQIVNGQNNTKTTRTQTTQLSQPRTQIHSTTIPKTITGGVSSSHTASSNTVTTIEAPKLVHMKPMTAVVPQPQIISQSRPKPSTNLITINIPGSHYYSGNSISSSTAMNQLQSSVNPQQQSQINQFRSVPHVVRPLTQASQPNRIIAASKSNAQIIQYQGASRVVQDTSSHLTSSQKLVMQPHSTLVRNVSDIQVGHNRQPTGNTISPLQSSSQVRHQQPQQQQQIANSNVKISSGAVTKTISQAPHKSSNPNVLAQSIKTSEPQVITRKQTNNGRVQQQTRDGHVYEEQRYQRGVTTSAQFQNQPKQYGLQHEIQKLKEVSQMIGQPVKQQREIKAENGVSFVSPITESKHIKFEQSAPREKEQVFIKAHNIVGTPAKPFQKKEIVSSNSEQNYKNAGTSNTNSISSSPLSFGKGKLVNSPSSNVQVIKAGTRTVQRQEPTPSTWTTPRQVTTMQTIVPSQKIKSSTKLAPYPSAGTVNKDSSEAKAIAKSEIEQLDALQNKLSEMVNKISANTENI